MRPQIERAGPSRTDAPAEPLGPDSLMWRYFGDWRGLIVSLWAGSMQNMHPQLGAGVEEHSHFFEERWQRLFRSTYPIGGVIYDGDRAAATAREVRDYHKTIKGLDKHGRPYSALNPETFWWAQATFILTPVLVCEYFGRPLTHTQKEQLYREGVQWYRMYGLSMRPVPPDWDAFMAYYWDMCENVLEVNQATLDVRDIRHIAKPPALPWLPDAVWRAIRVPIMSQMLWVTTGLYPEPVRRKLGLRWSRRDELLLRAMGRAVAAGWSLVPFERRLHPRARAGWQRVHGKIPPDAPLVQSPARNLPPESERGNPAHYCPS